MNKQIGSRVITAVVGIPLLVLIIGWGRPAHFLLLVFLLTIVALWEYFSMAFRGRWKQQALGVLFGVLAALSVILPGSSQPGLGLAGVVVLAFLSYLFSGAGLEERYQQLGWTLVGTLYVGFLVPHLFLLYRSHDGREWVFFILLVIMAGDTAGYFVGSSLGKKKLYPEISPGKTVEGAFASLAASALAGVVGGKYLLPAFPWMEILLLSLFLSLLGQGGDLFESWIKRVFAVKDSSRLLPGHGGLLDRMDSLIFPVVFATYYLRLIHP